MSENQNFKKRGGGCTRHTSADVFVTELDEDCRMGSCITPSHPSANAYIFRGGGVGTNDKGIIFRFYDKAGFSLVMQWNKCINTCTARRFDWFALHSDRTEVINFNHNKFCPAMENYSVDNMKIIFGYFISFRPRV